MPINLTEQMVKTVKEALVAIGRRDLAEPFVFPMQDFHCCWPALRALEHHNDALSRKAYNYISWNMLGLSY